MSLVSSDPPPSTSAPLALSQPPTGDEPKYYINPKDYRRAWIVEGVQGGAATLGVLGFNFATAHSVTEWVMPVAFQLACLGGAEFLRIPFAIKCRTSLSPKVRAVAFAGLMLGTGITSITLYQTAVTAFAPKFAALEDAQAELAEAKAQNAAFLLQYQKAKDAVADAQKRVEGDTLRATGASADLGKQAPVCTKHKCRAAAQTRELGKNLADARADKKADRDALGQATGALAKLDPALTGKAVLAKEAAERKAAREELFHRMASDLFGRELSDEQMMWVKRLTIGLPCIFVALAGSLFAFCSVHPIKRKPEPEPVEVPEIADLATLNAFAGEIVESASSQVVAALKDDFAAAVKATRTVAKQARNDLTLKAAIDDMAGGPPAAKSTAAGRKKKPDNQEAAEAPKLAAGEGLGGSAIPAAEKSAPRAKRKPLSFLAALNGAADKDAKIIPLLHGKDHPHD